MGTPGAELPRDTIRPACGVTHVVSHTNPTATFHPRPIGGLGFYAPAIVILKHRRAHILMREFTVLIAL
ncbi:MAG: hypothetical protein AB1777_02235 [Bacteroidota bacterium]